MKDAIFVWGMIAGCVIALTTSTIAYESRISALKQDAVKHGAAEYDQTTGVWQWKRADDGKVAE